MANNKIISVKCVDCGLTFDIGADEQKWYDEKGFKLPKRCPSCRRHKRSQKRK